MFRWKAGAQAAPRQRAYSTGERAGRGGHGGGGGRRWAGGVRRRRRISVAASRAAIQQAAAAGRSGACDRLIARARGCFTTGSWRSARSLVRMRAVEPVRLEGCASASMPVPERRAVLVSLRESQQPGEEQQPEEQPPRPKPCNDEDTASLPATPSSSPADEEQQILQDIQSEPAVAPDADSDAPADADTSSSAQSSPRRVGMEGWSWQLVEEGDRIACVMVTGADKAPWAQARFGSNGKARFGLEVDEKWHSQLESLIEMGYGVKVATEALRKSNGVLVQAFKLLEVSRHNESRAAENSYNR